MARRNVAEVLTGAIVLLVAAGFLGYALAHSGRGGGGSSYKLIARFDHIDGLSVGADVRMAGVRIGSVADAVIDPATYLAVVTLTVQDNLHLPRDSSAQITSDGLLGSEYVSLSPGGDERMLAPGQDITITQSAVNLEQLLGKFIFSVTDMVNATKPASGTAPATPPSPATAPAPGAK